MAGLRGALPGTVELIPGPGCPVCICPEEDIYEAIQDAWATYEEKLMAAWRASGAKESEQRETLWLAYQVCQKIKNHMESVMVAGKMASKQVEELNR